MKGDPCMPRLGDGSDDPCRSTTESEWKWIDLIRIVCDGNVPPLDMSEIRAIGETIEGHRGKLI